MNIFLQHSTKYNFPFRSGQWTEFCTSRCRKPSKWPKTPNCLKGSIFGRVAWRRIKKNSMAQWFSNQRQKIRYFQLTHNLEQNCCEVWKWISSRVAYWAIFLVQCEFFKIFFFQFYLKSPHIWHISPFLSMSKFFRISFINRKNVFIENCKSIEITNSNFSVNYWDQMPNT